MESWPQTGVSTYPLLNMRGSLGVVASVRSCAPLEIQEFFDGRLGAKERMFRIGTAERRRRIEFAIVFITHSNA